MPRQKHTAELVSARRDLASDELHAVEFMDGAGMECQAGIFHRHPPQGCLERPDRPRRNEKREQQASRSHHCGKRQHWDYQPLIRDPCSLQGEDLQIRPEAAQPGQSADQNGEGKRAHHERYNFVEGNQRHHSHPKAPIDDKVRKAEEILGENQCRQPGEGEGRRQSEFSGDVTTQGYSETPGGEACAIHHCQRLVSDPSEPVLLDSLSVFSYTGRGE